MFCVLDQMIAQCVVARVARTEPCPGAGSAWRRARYRAATLSIPYPERLQRPHRASGLADWASGAFGPPIWHSRTRAELDTRERMPRSSTTTSAICGVIRSDERVDSDR